MPYSRQKMIRVIGKLFVLRADSLQHKYDKISATLFAQ
jgi:hypothetical protein